MSVRSDSEHSFITITIIIIIIIFQENWTRWTQWRIEIFLRVAR